MLGVYLFSILRGDAIFSHIRGIPSRSKLKTQFNGLINDVAVMLGKNESEIRLALKAATAANTVSGSSSAKAIMNEILLRMPSNPASSSKPARTAE